VDAPDALFMYPILRVVPAESVQVNSERSEIHANLVASALDDSVVVNVDVDA